MIERKTVGMQDALMNDSTLNHQMMALDNPKAAVISRGSSILSRVFASCTTSISSWWPTLHDEVDQLKRKNRGLNKSIPVSNLGVLL
jgi:hypothetical protein